MDDDKKRQIQQDQSEEEDQRDQNIIEDTDLTE